MAHAEPKIAPAAEAAPAAAHSPEAAAKAPSALKLKLQKLKDALKSKLSTLGKFAPKKPALPQQKPKDLAKGAVKGVFEAIVAFPRWILFGDALTRIAAIGFLVSLGLVLLTAPEAVWILKNRLHAAAAGAQRNSMLDRLTSFFSEDQKEQALKLNAVVFLGKISTTLRSESEPQTAAVLEIEAFADCADEMTAQRLKAALPEAQEALAALVKGQAYENLMTAAGKIELRQKMRTSLETLVKAHAPGNDGAIKGVYITKFAAG